MKTFKQFLNENGLPFANVNDPEKLTLFGHTKKDVKEPEESDKDEDGEKTKEKRKGRKLFHYLAYAKSIND